jgi:GT2 family glycosyltransferase
MASIALVLLNYRYPQDTLACLESVRKSGPDAFKAYVVNNFASDGSGELLKDYLGRSGMAWSYLEPGGNLGYTGGMNLGIRAAMDEGFKHVLIMNNDVLVSEAFAGEAVAAARAHPGEVVAGCVLDFDTGKTSFNIGRITPFRSYVQNIWDADYAGDLDFVSGCMMLVPAEVFGKVGPFDDRYFMYREDFDFCMRLKQHGIRIRYWPRMKIRHKVSSTSDRSKLPKEYYAMRNQVHIILRRARPAQKAAFLAFLAPLLVYKLKSPPVFVQCVRGVIDAFLGRMGRRHKDSPAE